jgi:hypothetical protein
VPYDPKQRHGWARGLVHFHTQFSDGWASMLRAGEIAVQHGFDFLIVTDHLRNLKLFTHKTLQEYVGACDAATQRVGIPVIPGGEMEIHWNDPVTTDFSEAHTLALSIRSLVAAGEFDWMTPGTDPFGHWCDSQGGVGTILALQEKLRRYDLPPLASHQFQHSVMGLKPGEHSDFRYDLTRLATSRYFDFFYSGTVELIHEMEDILLVARYATADQEEMKAVYASCDFHIGPQTMWPPLANVKPLVAIWRWLLENVVPIILKLKGDVEAAPFPRFADEQLSHATYVHLGEQPCTEDAVLAALRDGRTCVTRGHAEFANFDPMPSFSVVRRIPVQISVRLPVSYSEPRPRSAIVFRDGRVVHWEPYAIIEPSLEFTYVDLQPPPGLHVYQVYVPSKFLSSPIVFADQHPRQRT